MTQHSGTALVTGASSGIGAVYADRLARRGHDLILVARSADRLDALATRLRNETGRKVEVLPADLSNAAQLAAVAERIAAESELTLLVNNAGIALDGTLATASADEVAKLIALNVTAPALLAQAALKAFQSRGAGGIINIASVLAKRSASTFLGPTELAPTGMIRSISSTTHTVFTQSGRLRWQQRSSNSGSPLLYRADSTGENRLFVRA